MSSASVYSFCLVLAILSFSNNSFAQVGKSRIVKYDTTARPGKVVLIDGSEITGNIVFNDNDGIVTVHSNGNDRRSFNAKRLMSFQFYNSNLNRHQRFYCLDFTDPKTGVTNVEFFEVLKEFKTFAVLSKIERLKSQVPYRDKPVPVLTDIKNFMIIQSEIVYFVTSDGLFEPYLYLEVREVEGDLLDTHGKSSWFIDEDLFKKYTAQHYRALSKYAAGNKLNFERKEDLIKILDEYEKLLAAR
jgi:hypothetical protein